MQTYREGVEAHEPSCEVIELQRWSRELLDPLAVAAAIPVVVQLVRAWLHRADDEGVTQLLYALPWMFAATSCWALGRHQSTTRLELDAQRRVVRIARPSWFSVVREVVPYDDIQTVELRATFGSNASLVLVTTDGNEHLLLVNATCEEQELSVRGRLRRAREDGLALPCGPALRGVEGDGTEGHER